VGSICQRIKDEFQTWRTRDLSGTRLDYLFLDGRTLRCNLRTARPRAGLFRGIDTDGEPVLPGLAPASSESSDTWDDFLGDLVCRGLRAPLLGISDGASGLIGALEQPFRTSLYAMDPLGHALAPRPPRSRQGMADLLRQQLVDDGWARAAVVAWKARAARICCDTRRGGLPVTDVVRLASAGRRSKTPPTPSWTTMTPPAPTDASTGPPLPAWSLASASGWRPLAFANPPPSLRWWLVLTVVVGPVPAPGVSSIKASRSFQRKAND
jgi:Transposase, Mutator family